MQQPDEEGAGLDVAVDQTLLMGFPERAADRAQKIHHATRRQRAVTAHQRVERRARQVLHGVSVISDQ